VVIAANRLAVTTFQLGLAGTTSGSACEATVAEAIVADDIELKLYCMPGAWSMIGDGQEIRVSGASGQISHQAPLRLRLDQASPYLGGFQMNWCRQVVLRNF
jgi:hypothetical protein